MKIRLLILSFVTLCWSCTQYFSVEQGELDEAFTLSFQMLTAPDFPSSRTDGVGHDEIDSEYEQFEDGIDLADLGIFIFARFTDDSNTTENLVYKTTDIPNDKQISVVGSPGSYTVNLVITNDQLAQALGVAVDPNSSRLVSFRVLMLANACSPGTETDIQAQWNKVNGSTFTEVIGQLNNWSYAMANLYNINAPTDAVTDLYRHNGHCIPMFGTNLFSVAQDILYNSRVDRVIRLGQVDMLRALAKVRVIDNITTRDSRGYPRIISASIIGTKDQVYPLPNSADEYINGNQVHTPNIYKPAEFPSDYQANPTYRLGLVPNSWVNEDLDGSPGSVRVGFIPEQRIDYAGAINRGLPTFRITVAFSDEAEYTIDYDVPMTGYTPTGSNQTTVFKDWFNPDAHPGSLTHPNNASILRNHIYTLSINIENAKLSCSVDLVPYRGCTLDPDFGMEDDYYKPAITEIWVTPQVEVFSGTWDSNAPDWSNPNSIKATPNTRFATVSGGKMYTIDQKTMSIAEITPEGTLKPKYYLPNPANLGPLGTPTDYYGTAIAADEEGNFLIGMNFTQRPTSSTKFAIYSPATGVCKLFSLKPPEDWIVGRLDCIGHVLGDLTRDAVFTIVPESDYADNGTVIETTSKVRIIKVSGDGTLGSVTMTDIRHVPVGGNNTPQNIAVPAYHTMAEAKAANAVYDFYYSSCNGFANYYAYYNGSEVKSNFAPRMLTTTVAGNNGFDTFVVDGKRYFVRNSATIIQQRTMNIVVMDDRGRGLARWENPDYVVNSGYSTIVAVPLEDNTVDIYVFNSGTNSGAAAKLNFNPLQVH